MAPMAGKNQFGRALKHSGATVAQMRKELAEAVGGLFAGRRAEPQPISDDEADRIGDTISLAVRLRELPVNRALLVQGKDALRKVADVRGNITQSQDERSRS